MMLISDYMLAQNQALHDAPEGFGGSGHRHLHRVVEFARMLRAKSILDYGCGEGTLKWGKRTPSALRALMREYDPAVRGKEELPEPADLVVSTDVFEHVEPDCLDAVVAHIAQLSRKGCYLVIATRPANKLLPDGRNAHLIVQPPGWWAKVLFDGLAAFRSLRFENVCKKDGRPHELRLWGIR